MRYISVYLVCFLIFIVWLRYEQHKRQKAEQKATDEFWAREEQANQTRNKDISNLPLLTVCESKIPLTPTGHEGVDYNIDKITESIHLPMMDLSEYSNTDLKLAYGVGNFKTLSEYDENFNQFLINLTVLARSYARESLLTEAIATYEYAIEFGSVKLNDYTELAELYLQQDDPQLVTALIQQVQSSEIPRKENLVLALQKVFSSYQ